MPHDATNKQSHPLETRIHTVRPEEVRAEGDAEQSRKLSGTVLSYRKQSDLGYFREQFEAGCFTRYLSEQPDATRALHHHDPKQLLASTRAGTLRLTDTPTALTFEMDVARTSYGDDVLQLVRIGEVEGMSFGFRVIEDRERIEKDDQGILRTVLEAELPEITVTSIPAHSDTSVSARSAGNAGEVDQAAIDKAAQLQDRPQIRSRRMQLNRMLTAQAA